jgi:hypothetical protein
MNVFGVDFVERVVAEVLQLALCGTGDQYDGKRFERDFPTNSSTLKCARFYRTTVNCVKWLFTEYLMELRTL